MNRIIHHIKTLLYCDGPELFVGADQIDTRYLCLLTEASESMERFFCVPVSPDTLAGVAQGSYDVRKVFESSETKEYFFAELDSSFEQDIVLNPVDESEVSEAWLPEADFFLEPEPLSSDAVIKEAQEKNCAVLHLALDPPESRGGMQINANTLSEAINTFQSLVKYAYKKSISQLSPSTKKLIDTQQNYDLEVFNFSPGSFKVHLQSSSMADLVGDAEVARAFRKIDEITSRISDPEESLNILKENRGHLVNTYKKLLKLIISSDAPLYYSWSTPHRDNSCGSRISKNSALTLYELLEQREDLGAEQREIIGVVPRADVGRGHWEIVDDEGSHYSGGIDQDHDASLAGITLETTRYKFICEERLESEVFSGKEKPRLFLISYEAV